MLSATCLFTYSQAGAPDPSFGSGGVVTTSFGAVQAGSNCMAIQNDGKIVMAGHINNGTNVNFAVTRYNTNGTPDNGFDGDGKLVTIIGTDDDAKAVTIQQDGRIVVAGRVHFPGQGDDIALVRYNLNGSPDNSFSSDGIVTTSIDAVNLVAYAVAVQADGKIVVAGGAGAGTNLDFVVIRYNADGTLDNNFGGGGIVITAIGSSNDQVYALVLQADGKIVVAGNGNMPTASDFVIVRYNVDGSLDNSFNGTGKIIAPVGDARDLAGLAIQADGKIVVAGGDGNGFVILRFNTNGSTDNSFDGDGIVRTLVGSQSEATSVIIQPDGKIVVAGHALAGPLWDFAIARYNVNGSLDNSFDGDGIVTKNVNGDDFGFALKLSGQRLYVGGVSNQVVFTLLALQTGSVALPLQLLNFSAFNQGNGVVLNWQTAAEQNTAHFNIERSSDGLTFSKIGQVQAAGNSTGENYSFTDLVPNGGLVFYRLKMIDADGHFTYSSTVLVRMKTYVGLQLFPNPAKNVLNVTLPAAPNKTTVLQIRDASGKIVIQQTIQARGSRSAWIEIAALSNGIYFLVAENDTGKTIMEFIKQ